MSHPYVLYVIYCHDPNQRIRSYIGITNNLQRRLRKHRGELKGGAKYTKLYTEKGCEWTLAATAHGARDWNEVLKIEWALQHPDKSKHLKHRGYVGSNILSRNLSNLFYMTRAKTKLSHIWAALHFTPSAVKNEILAEKFDHFLLLSPALLLKNCYADFIQLRHEGDKTSVSPAPVVRHRAQRKRPAEYYREQARKLLEQSSDCFIVSSSLPARRHGPQSECIVID